MDNNFTEIKTKPKKSLSVKKLVQYSLILTTLIFSGLLVNRFVNRGKATEEIATITFIPKNKTVKKDDTIDQSIQISTPDQKISAIDLTLKFDRGYLEYLAQSDNLILKTIPPNYFTEVILEKDTLNGDQSSARIVLIANKPNEELVNNVVVSLSFMALKKTSGTRISLNKDQSIVVGTTGSVSSQDHTFTLDTTNAFSQLTIQDNTETTNNISVKIKAKLQAINSKPKRGEKVKMNVNFYGEKDNKQNVKDVEFISDDKGVYSATVPLNKLSAGPNFKLFIKGPMHVQKRICHKTPTGGILYNCNLSQTGFELTNGENTMDLTNVPLLAGDLPLPQDSILNAKDISALNKCLLKRTEDCLNSADVNYDGVVNANDFAIVTNSMAIKYDDEN